MIEKTSQSGRYFRIMAERQQNRALILEVAAFSPRCGWRTAERGRIRVKPRDLPRAGYSHPFRLK